MVQTMNLKNFVLAKAMFW